jgi:3-oxoacyl-[acyl-carrier-protein] synthase II
LDQKRRVVITGLGIVSPFGSGSAAFLNGIREGRRATRRISLFDPEDLPCQVAAEVPDFDPSRHLPADDLQRVGRIVPMALAAARECIADAGLGDGALDDGERRRIGVLVGSGAGAVDFAERQYEAYYRQGIRRVNPFAISSSVVGMVSSELSIRLGFTGPSHVLSNGCTSSTDAIGYALHAIQRADHSVLLTGGAEACITRGMMEGFCRMRAAAVGWNDRPARASRPFNRDRTGFVLGEGAFLMALEDLDHARRRDAPIYAEVAGYAATCDAYHRVHMSPQGDESTRAMQEALRSAGARPEEVDYINLHGTGTPQNDRVETLAVRSLLGPAANRVPCSSTKSMIGHPQGACGAAGVAATAFALRDRFLPPTANYENPDPQCDLDYVPNDARAASPALALCNCIGFGSKNAALVLRAMRE